MINNVAQPAAINSYTYNTLRWENNQWYPDPESVTVQVQAENEWDILYGYDRQRTPYPLELSSIIPINLLGGSKRKRKSKRSSKRRSKSAIRQKSKRKSERVR